MSGDADGLKLLFLDVETTGIASPACGLIQLGAIVELEGEEVETFEARARPFPQDRVEDDALALHGLTRAQLTQLPAPEDAYARLIALLGKYVDRYDKRDKFHLVAYNAAFDTAHLRAWFDKLGDRYFGAWFWHPSVDVMGLAAALLMRRRAKLPDFRLTTVARALGVPVDDAQTHGALYDARLTRAVFGKLRERLKPF